VYTTQRSLPYCLGISNISMIKSKQTSTKVNSDVIRQAYQSAARAQHPGKHSLVANNGVAWLASNSVGLHVTQHQAIINIEQPRVATGGMELRHLCMRMQDVAMQETRNKKKTAITCFTAVALISFATNRVVAPVYSDVPLVGQQASKTIGSGIASCICVGSSSMAC